MNLHGPPFSSDKKQRRQKSSIFINRNLDNLKPSPREATILARHSASFAWRKERGTSDHIELSQSTLAILHQLHLLRKASNIPEETSEDAATLIRPTGYQQQTLHTCFDREAGHAEPIRADLDDSNPTSAAGSSSSAAVIQNSQLMRRYSTEILKRHPLAQVGHQCLDPFSTSKAMSDFEVRSSLCFYFNVIRPFASHLLPVQWYWFSDMSATQTTPALAYAIAALASAFLSGCKKGGPGVVLPPMDIDTVKCKVSSDTLSWPVPPWFRFHELCVQELRAQLSQPRADLLQDQTIFETTLILFRLAVLLGDGVSGRIHLIALQRLLKAARGYDQDRRPRLDLWKELALLRMNLIAAFLHSPSVVIIMRPSDRPRSQVAKSLMVTFDSTGWGEIDHGGFHIHTHARLLCWTAGMYHKDYSAKNSSLRSKSEAAIRRVEGDGWRRLNDTEKDQILRCYSMAFSLLHYLSAINYCPGSNFVKEQMLEIKLILELAEMSSLHRDLPRTLFCVLLAASMASRGQYEHSCWIDSIARLYKGQIDSVHDILAVLEQCYDPYIVNHKILDEIWEEIRLSMMTKQRLRAQDKHEKPKESLNPRNLTTFQWHRPFTYDPPLGTAKIRIQKSNPR